MKEKNLLSRILQNISCPAGILGTDDFTGNEIAFTHLWLIVDTYYST